MNISHVSNLKKGCTLEGITLEMDAVCGQNSSWKLPAVSTILLPRKRSILFNISHRERLPSWSESDSNSNVAASSRAWRGFFGSMYIWWRRPHKQYNMRNVHLMTHTIQEIQDDQCTFGSTHHINSTHNQKIRLTSNTVQYIILLNDSATSCHGHTPSIKILST